MATKVEGGKALVAGPLKYTVLCGFPKKYRIQIRPDINYHRKISIDCVNNEQLDCSLDGYGPFS